MKSILAVFALSGLWLAAVAAGPQSSRTATLPIASPTVTASPAPTPSAMPTSSPTPTPMPPTPTSQAAINLSQAAGQPGTPLVVTGSGFPAGQPVTIYLDGPNRPVGPPVYPNPDGTFQQSVTIPDGAATGDHRVCASSAGGPACARFQVSAVANATPTPFPTAASVPGPTPTDTTSPSAAAVGPGSATGTPQGSSALSTLFPWILIPIAALLALAGLVVWLLRRGQDAPPGARRTFGAAGGSGIPTITHRSPQPIGAAPGARRPGAPPPDGPVTVEWLPADPLPIEPPPAGQATVEWLPAGATPIESGPAGLPPAPGSPPAGLPPAPPSELISPSDEPANQGGEPGAGDGGSGLSGLPIITHRSPQPFGELPAAEPDPPAGGDKPSGS